MKDYNHLEDLKESLQCANVISDEFEREYLVMCRNMGSIRKVLEDMQVTVNNKMMNEGLQSWLDGPPAHPAGECIILQD